MPRVKTGFHRALQLFVPLFLAAAVLTGCGGGGGSDSSAPAKTSFTAGPITGFGSVIVNGTRFDVSRARITDDTGQVRGEQDLKLGMVTEVRAGDLTSNNTSQATDVSFGSAIIGPVDAINTSTRLLIVLGQTVDVSDTTVFGESLPAGPFGISRGDVLEIFGMLDATTGHYAATRIEAKPDATLFKLRGKVANLNSGAGTFMMGGETISFGSLSRDRIPALSNGMEVIADLQMTPDRNGNWVASQIRTTTSGTDSPVASYGKVKLKGFVTSVDSPVHFTVSGIPVDASNAKMRPKKVPVFLGAQVKVEGPVREGTIIATKVHIKHNGKAKEEDEDDDDDDDDEHGGYELHGAVEGFDASSRTFIIRGVPVSYAGAAFEKGTQYDLRAGRKAEVKGTLSANGRRIEAVHIRFED